MASTINADDGVVSGSAGVKTSADNSGVLELQSNGATQFTLGSSSVVINEAGADVDFRVEGDTDSNLLFVDASTDRVGVGTNAPTQKLDVDRGATNGVVARFGRSSGQFAYIYADTNSVYLSSDSSGNTSWEFNETNDYLAAWTGGTERLRLASGNLGLGVTPSAWNTAGKAFEFSKEGNAVYATASNTRYDTSNAYLNSSGNFIYSASNFATFYSQFNGTHSWHTAASGNAGDPISFTQALSVGLGTSLALQGATSQTGTGITFPATQNASSNANTLDDYEEGTWTPTVTGNITDPVYTASIASGNYTKIGRMVYVEFLIVITGVTSQGTGNVNISGLPFSSSSGIYQSNISFVYNDTWDVNVRNGYTVGTVIQPVPNSVTQSNLGWSGATLSTGYFSGSGWYIA
jgi:hypothetical protein